MPTSRRQCSRVALAPEEPRFERVTWSNADQVTRVRSHPSPSITSRIRVLKLHKVIFTHKSTCESFLYGQQAAPMPDDAVAAFFANVERCAPNLEHWETVRGVEYMSKKEMRSGSYQQPPPVLRKTDGLIYPKLKIWHIENINFDIDASFRGCQAPALEDLTLAGSNLSGNLTTVPFIPSARLSKEARHQAQFALVKPLRDAAERPVLRVRFDKTEKK